MIGTSQGTPRSDYVFPTEGNLQREIFFFFDFFFFFGPSFKECGHEDGSPKGQSEVKFFNPLSILQW